MSEAARTVGKRVNRAALGALVEALTAIYWYKGDLERFIRGIVRRPEIVSRLTFADAKRVVATELVDLLAADQDRYLETLLELMAEVSSFSDFSHLSRLEDGRAKAEHAKQVVGVLKKQYEAHAGLVSEREEIERRRQEARVHAARREALTEKLETLRQAYVELVSLADAQARGYRFQRLLSQLFSLFDLDPKASFALEGEQLDGAFSFENADYQLEAKWQKNPVEPADLRDFDGKIQRKLKTTLGLFIAINGFADAAVKNHSRVGAAMVLMDGGDLYAILERRITLPEVLHRKRRHASQTGDIYIRVHEF
jgi:Restriction endonuclease